MRERCCGSRLNTCVDASRDVLSVMIGWDKNITRGPARGLYVTRMMPPDCHVAGSAIGGLANIRWVDGRRPSANIISDMRCAWERG